MKRDARPSPGVEALLLMVNHTLTHAVGHLPLQVVLEPVGVGAHCAVYHTHAGCVGVLVLLQATDEACTHDVLDEGPEL